MRGLRLHHLKYPLIFFVSKIPVGLLLRYSGFLDVYLWESRYSEFRWSPYAPHLPAKIASIRSGRKIPMVSDR